MQNRRVSASHLRFDAGQEQVDIVLGGFEARHPTDLIDRVVMVGAWVPGVEGRPLLEALDAGSGQFREHRVGVYLLGDFHACDGTGALRQARGHRVGMSTVPEPKTVGQ